MNPNNKYIILTKLKFEVNSYIFTLFTTISLSSSTLMVNNTSKYKVVYNSKSVTANNSPLTLPILSTTMSNIVPILPQLHHNPLYLSLFISIYPANIPLYGLLILRYIFYHQWYNFVSTVHLPWTLTKLYHWYYYLIQIQNAIFIIILKYLTFIFIYLFLILFTKILSKNDYNGYLTIIITIHNSPKLMVYPNLTKNDNNINNIINYAIKWSSTLIHNLKILTFIFFTNITLLFFSFVCVLILNYIYRS